MRAVNHPTNTTIMVVPFVTTAAGPDESALPTPGYLCRRGWSRVVFKSFIL
jgi:hypothetical protein